MNINPAINFFKEYPVRVQMFFVLFYCVGIIGLFTDVTRPLFVKLTPAAIILSAVSLVIFHQKPIIKREIVLITTICFAGFIIEAVGVNTGLIFGKYQYQSGLGPGILGTPVIIGLNWLILVYCSASISDMIGISLILKIFSGALIMLMYDVVLEQVAPFMQMWTWEQGIVPIQNYLAWFVIALVFHFAIRVYKLNVKNKLAATVLVSQFIFFLVIWFLAL